MDRKSLTFTVVLALTITLKYIPITAQRNAVPLRNEPNQVTQINNAPDQRQTQTKTTPVITAPEPAPAGSNTTTNPTDENISIQRELAASTRTLAHDTQRYADYTFYLVGVAAIVGMLQIILFVFQAVYTGKAANAATRSSNALKVLHRQWLDTSEFELRPQTIDGRTGLEVRFVITNNTPLPLMVSRVRCFINGTLNGLDVYQPLGPQGRYRIPRSCLNLFLPPDEAVTFRGPTGITLTVAGWVDFTDTFEEPRSQPFARVVSPCRFDAVDYPFGQYHGSMIELLESLQHEEPEHEHQQH